MVTTDALCKVVNALAQFKFKDKGKGGCHHFGSTDKLKKDCPTLQKGNPFKGIPNNQRRQRGSSTQMTPQPENYA